jgi:type II secretory pathway pseudopilin PulG
LGLISVAAGGQNNLAIFFSDFAILFIFWIYFVLMTHYAGATLGKMLVGIRVQSDTFGRLSFGRVLLRETIGKFISGLIFSIGFIIAGFTDRKRALHDMFAHSVVVYKNPEKPHGAGLVVGIIIATILPLIAILGILSSIVLVSLNTARQLGVAQKKGQDARVMELVSEMRASAEIYYGNNNNSYSIAKGCSSGMFTDPNIQSSLSSLTNNTPTCYAEGQSYAVSAPLSTPGSNFCVDNTGKAGNGVAVDTGSDASCQMSAMPTY